MNRVGSCPARLSSSLLDYHLGEDCFLDSRADNTKSFPSKTPYHKKIAAP